MSELVFGDDNDAGAAAADHGTVEVGGAPITEKASKRVTDNRNKAIGEKQTHLAVQVRIHWLIHSFTNYPLTYSLTLFRI